ncbi:MAG: NifB/NifX family molybdenum-iron cluster-binding protein [bacterium]|nr:NifB/NifX family molybdenum-iron cluster-binding protein [bacterium]MDT8366500.1 NifB/NifX family molybdenum-iron cluster-binding protein [bacterium]
MKICFPVNVNEGLNSQVHGHFGSAKGFLIFDPEANAFEEHHNPDRQHLHGACQPFSALGGREVDAVVVGRIGSGALTGLTRAGLKVYQAGGQTVAENIESFKEGILNEITADKVCGGHGHGYGCEHGHSH